MAAYKFERLVDDSHLVQLPQEVPKGWVEISVVPKEDLRTRSERYFAMLEELLATPADNPLTAEEIQSYVRRERDSWE